MNKTIIVILLAQLFTLASYAIERSVPLPYDYTRSVTANVARVPNCTPSQYVAVSGTFFICKDLNISSCPAGQVVASVMNGLPVCRKLVCRQVGQHNGTSPHYFSTASCNNDEILTGGGGASENDTPNVTGCSGAKSFIHTSLPYGNGWGVDAFQANWQGEACTYSVAICCKFE